MPSVGDLHGLWCSNGGSPAIAAASIARNHGDLRMGSHPRLDGAGLAVRKQIDDPAPLKITDDRAVSLTPLPGKVVNTKDSDSFGPRPSRAPPHHPQQSVPADRQHQPMCQAGGGATAQD
jgi:hypothetical protein